MAIEPILTGWPIVEIHYPETVTVETMAAVYDQIAEFLGRQEPFAIIHHTTSGLDAHTRRYMAQRRSEQAGASSVFLKAEALIAQSPLVRGAATAIAWLFPHPHPFRAFGTAAGALAWAQARVAKASSQPEARA